MLYPACRAKSKLRATAVTDVVGMTDPGDLSRNSGDYFRLRCFHGARQGDDAEGNLAEVRVLQAAGLPKLVAAAAHGEDSLWGGIERPAAAAGLARVWIARDAAQYRIETFGPAATVASVTRPGPRSGLSRPVGFCGHGALAAAFVAFAELEPDANELRFANHGQHWLARRRGSLTRADPVGLVFPRPAIGRCSPPEFVAACLAAQPVAAARVGDAQGYLIAELSDVAELATLQPDFALLAGATMRALIVTAADPGVGGHAFAFRYFAPQYGPPEDAATGSAAVQLAAYWQPRLGAGHLEARQLSPQGGRMRLVCAPTTVELRGRVAYG